MIFFQTLTTNPGGLLQLCRVVCLVSTLFFPPYLKALQTSSLPSQIRFERFPLTSGISDLTINDIAQDRIGFLWIATRNGLSRYDGERFRVFRNIPGDSTSLIVDNVQEVFVDSAGTVWAGTIRGLCRFDADRNAFKRFFAEEDVNAIVQDSDGWLWLGIAGRGLIRMDPVSEEFRRHVHSSDDPCSLSSNTVLSLNIDREGIVWVGTLDAGLNRLDPLTGMVERFLHDKNNGKSLGDGRIESIAEDDEGNVWIGTEHDGLNLFEPETRTFRRYKHDPLRPGTISSNSVSGLLFDRSGTTWVGTQGGGVCRFDRVSGTFQAFTTDHFDPSSLSDDYATCIFEDRTGEIWIGTGSGLNKVLRHSSVVRHVSNIPGREKNLAGLSVHSLLKDRSGILWVGTSGGLTRIAKGVSTHYLENIRLKDGSPASGIGALEEDRDGNLWVGTNGAGVFRATRLNPMDETLRMRQFRNEKTNFGSLSNDNIFSIYEDHSGTLWVGTDGGLNKYDPGTGTWIRYLHKDSDSSSISNNSVMSLHEDGAGVLWIGTMSGLNAFNRRSGEFTRFLPSAGDPNSLSHRAVFGIAGDRQNKLWVATARGLSVLDAERKRFRNYFPGDGLPDVFLKGVVTDTNGVIWISSRSGITRAHQDSSGLARFTNYGLSDGLPVEDFSPLAFCASDDGEVLFGAGNGLVRFYPAHLRHGSDPPPIAITALKVFNEERPMVPDLELPFDENHVSLEFSALDFGSPEKHRFEYMMVGLDRNWLAADHARTALYPNLSPGSYGFRVRGANADGVWNTEGAMISFTILPPFWETWWFRSAAIIALVGLVMIAYNYRVRKIQEMERLRLRLASDLHDELASNLNSIAMFGRIVHDETIQRDGDTGQRAVLLDRITDLAQESVHAIREIIWALDPKLETLHDILLRVRDAASAACNAKEIKLHFVVPDRKGLPQTNLSPEIRRNISLLMKEVINNAISHSQCMDLFVEPLMEGQTLSVMIRDNGRGFDPLQPYKGKGLKTTRERARELGSELVVHSGADKGTSVQFSVKIT